MAATPLTFKITGLGHNLTLELAAEKTVGDLKAKIEESSGLPPCYQRLLARRLKLEDNSVSLEDAGLKDRTKIMLLHSPLYSQEKDAFELVMKT